MIWRVECKYSRKGHDVIGDFTAALREAQAQCTTDSSTWVVWALPGNLRMAEVTLRGVRWIKSTLTGREVTQLMRGHHKTIAGLAFVMGITQNRIRQVRARGLTDPHAVRDWIEAITGDDPGPLPERYRIGRRDEETYCAYCGCPLSRGDTAFAYAVGIFCSVECSRRSRQPTL